MQKQWFLGYVTMGNVLRPQKKVIAEVLKMTMTVMTPLTKLSLPTH